MRIEEQIKAINKQIDFLVKFKDKLTNGKQEKEIGFNYTVNCLKDAVKVLEGCNKVKQDLIDNQKSLHKSMDDLEELTRTFIM